MGPRSLRRDGRPEGWHQTSLTFDRSDKSSPEPVSTAMLQAIGRDGIWTLHQPVARRPVVRIPLPDGRPAIVAGLSWPDLVGAFPLVKTMRASNSAEVELVHWPTDRAMSFLAIAARHRISTALWTDRGERLTLLDSASTTARELTRRVPDSDPSAHTNGRFDLANFRWREVPTAP